MVILFKRKTVTFIVRREGIGYVKTVVKTNHLMMLFVASNVLFLKTGTLQEARKREFYENQV